MILPYWFGCDVHKSSTELSTTSVVNFWMRDILGSGNEVVHLFQAFIKKDGKFPYHPSGSVIDAYQAAMLMLLFRASARLVSSVNNMAICFFSSLCVSVVF